jgi:hypothetical protein
MMSDQGLIWGAGFNDPCLLTKRVLGPALREMQSILRASTVVEITNNCLSRKQPSHLPQRLGGIGCWLH